MQESKFIISVTVFIDNVLKPRKKGRNDVRLETIREVLLIWLMTGNTFLISFSC